MSGVATRGYLKSKTGEESLATTIVTDQADTQEFSLGQKH